MTGGVGSSQGAEAVPSFSGMTLALGRGLRADRCQRMSSMDRDAFVTGGDARAWGQWGMQQGGCDEGPGSGVWQMHLDRGFGLGMGEMGM